MKGSGLVSLLSLVLLFFLSTASAWPSQEDLDSALDRVLHIRQNSDDEAAASSTAANDDEDAAPSTARSSASATDDAESSGSTSGARSASRTGSGSGSASRTTSTRTTPIDPRLPPGGIALMTPAPIDGPQYYKVGDFVTFKWNYTSLSVSPKAIDVLASCSVNSATYTITSNMTVEETGAVTWDTGEFQATASNPFPVASYTLIVHDSSKDFTDVPSAGYLGAYAQYVFGMYTGKPYVPLNEFKCATCNGALSLHEKQALGVVLTTAAITFLSFTWFANGFGVF